MDKTVGRTVGEVILEVKDLNVHYSGVHALKGINFSINRGDIATILGANGAGKTTTLRAISGLTPSSRGSIFFKGQNISKIPAHKIVALGLAHSPEGRMIFPNLTVWENLEMGAYLRKDKPQLKQDLDFIVSIFPKLQSRAKQLAGTLSGGEQQMLAIGRALMAGPELLMMDEPSLGIAPILVKSIFEAIVHINKEHKTTILVVEQNANLALKVAHQGFVLETGMMTLKGTGAELAANPEVKAAYLGH